MEHGREQRHAIRRPLYLDTERGRQEGQRGLVARAPHDRIVLLCGSVLHKMDRATFNARDRRPEREISPQEDRIVPFQSRLMPAGAVRRLCGVGKQEFEVPSGGTDDLSGHATKLVCNLLAGISKPNDLPKP